MLPVRRHVVRNTLEVFYDIYTARALPAYEYTLADAQEYVEIPDFCSYAESAQAAALRRVEHIRAIVPKGPVG